MSKWSSMHFLFLPKMMRISVTPLATASSTTYCSVGVSTMGSISLGSAFVAGKNLVPNPAAGMTAFLTLCIPSLLGRRAPPNDIICIMILSIGDNFKPFGQKVSNVDKIPWF